jgi:hypothetical protein
VPLYVLIAITGRLQDNLKGYTNASRMLVPAKATVRLRYALSSLLGMHMYMYNLLATLCLHNTTGLLLQLDVCLCHKLRNESYCGT